MGEGHLLSFCHACGRLRSRRIKSRHSRFLRHRRQAAKSGPSAFRPERSPSRRPESRTKSNHRKPDSRCDTKQQRAPPSFPETLTAPVFSLCRLRTESASHPSGSSMLRYPATALAAFAAPGNVVPSRVQGGDIRMAVAVATPVRCWLAAWAIQSYAFNQMAQRQRPIIRGICARDRFPGSPSFAKPFTRNIDSLRRAFVRVACGSRRTPIYTPRLDGHDAVSLSLLVFIETFWLAAVTHGEVRRYHKGPGQVLVAVLLLPSPFFLPLLSCKLSTQRQ